MTKTAWTPEEQADIIAWHEQRLEALRLPEDAKELLRANRGTWLVYPFPLGVRTDIGTEKRNGQDGE